MSEQETKEVKVEQQAQEGEVKQPSKNELKKLQKQKEKEEKERKKKEAELARKAEEEAKEKQDIANDPLNNLYGDLPLIQSTEQTGRKWIDIADVNESLIGQEVLIRCRLHNVRKGKIAFLILRQTYSTLQAVAAYEEGVISNPMVKFIGKVPCESVIDIVGKVTAAEVKSEFITQKGVELAVKSLHVVTRSRTVLPFQLEDASRKVVGTEMEDEEEQKTEAGKDEAPRVTMKTRLDNRILDLRTPAKQAIFKVQSAVCFLFREFLMKEDFMEIHTPKLIGGSSEGGSNVFSFKYFNQDACLAQSPQLYKQMCIMADFKRVFEIGPVFRAENSFTHRHMCEFTGLDLEMEIKEHYFELLDLMSDLFVHIFNGLETRFAKELEAIKQQYDFEPFVCKTPVVKITFEEGCKMLKEAGIDQDPLEDIDTATERKLGELVKQKYETDFYMLHRYPKSARPFYTMLCKDDPNYTLSYDFFMRGEEITSGAQRNHDPESLRERAIECGISPDTLKSYIDAFTYGSNPHGGCGIGLERVIFLYCNMGNIRNSSLFPRDPRRIYP